jgi:hypothetical protein
MRMLWHVNYWDGPLSGLCLLNGRKHWFQIKGGVYDPDDEAREFEIIYLTDEQIKAEDDRHNLWVKYVGEHCDYDEHNKRRDGDLRLRREWAQFYNLPALERNYTNVVKVVSESELREAVEAILVPSISKSISKK